MNKVFSFRLNPNEDLKNEIQNFCEKNNILAGCILSAVGSLETIKIRLANSQNVFETTEKFEIVSVSGTVSRNGCHLHIAVADSNGKVTGGHLMNGNKIYTTCEIIILCLKDQEFKRENDVATGFNELKIYFKKS